MTLSPGRFGSSERVGPERPTVQKQVTSRTGVGGSVKRRRPRSNSRLNVNQTLRSGERVLDGLRRVRARRKEVGPTGGDWDHRRPVGVMTGETRIVGVSGNATSRTSVLFLQD